MVSFLSLLKFMHAHFILMNSQLLNNFTIFDKFSQSFFFKLNLSILVSWFLIKIALNNNLYSIVLVNTQLMVLFLQLMISPFIILKLELLYYLFIINWLSNYFLCQLNTLRPISYFWTILFWNQTKVRGKLLKSGLIICVARHCEWYWLDL